MGITISSKRHSCDMGYGGFGRFRNLVAEKVNDEFYKHYLKLSDTEIVFLYGESREAFFGKYDTLTTEFIKQNAVTVEVANFLYQSDCEGKINRKQAKQIYELIKECDNNIIFGYSGRIDCAKMSDLKNILADGTIVKWR